MKRSLAAIAAMACAGSLAAAPMAMASPITTGRTAPTFSAAARTMPTGANDANWYASPHGAECITSGGQFRIKVSADMRTFTIVAHPSKKANITNFKVMFRFEPAPGASGAPGPWTSSTSYPDGAFKTPGRYDQVMSVTSKTPSPTPTATGRMRVVFERAAPVPDITKDWPVSLACASAEPDPVDPGAGTDAGTDAVSLG